MNFFLTTYTFFQLNDTFYADTVRYRVDSIEICKCILTAGRQKSRNCKCQFDCAQNALKREWGFLYYLQMGVTVMGFVEDFLYGLQNS